jgi:hypothetical protein
MFRLWNALPYNQWVTVKELRRLTEKMSDGTRHSALSALIARNLVKRRPSRANLNAYDYLRLREDAAVETPDGPYPETVKVEGGGSVPRDVGGEEPFAPPAGGATETTTIPLTLVLHGTARRYMSGCRCVECEQAYETTRKALGLS